MKILNCLLPFAFILSTYAYSEAVGDKNGYLKEISNVQLEKQVHQFLIKKIKIENPQPYTDKSPHWHTAIWGCTKAVKHTHKGSRKHAHKYNCGGRGRPVGVPALRRMVPAPAPAPKSAPQASSTNVQEAGVDEADFVKTDGRYLFAINNAPYDKRSGGIRIFDTQSGGIQPKQIAAIGFQKGIKLSGMYLTPKTNRLVVIGTQYNGKKMRKNAPRWNSVTSIITVDISNKTKPKVIQHVKVEGMPKNSRRIGNQLYMVLTGNNLSFPSTYKYHETPKKMTTAQHEGIRQGIVKDIKSWKVESSLPHYQVLGKTGAKPLVNSGRFLINPGDISSYGLTTLLAIDLGATTFTFDTLNYFGYAGSFYASTKAFYLTPSYSNPVRTINKSRFPKGSQHQLIHKFAYKGKGFDYRGTGAVIGHLGWSQTSTFQLDEDAKGNLRVVTSNWHLNRSSNADPASKSPVVITALAEHPQNKQLVTLSRLPNKRQPKALGKKGEQLYGARLFNDYAYFVTFRRTDPLYVVDLRNPRFLNLVGELEIPGFSDYLHPINQNLLLGVGKEATQQGRVQGLKLSLFDISNPRKPREIHKIELGESGTHSPASHNHHAFTSLKMRNSPITRISLPVSLMTKKDKYRSEEGLYQFEVNTHTKRIRHAGELISPKTKNQYWSWNRNDRSIIIDNTLYYYKNGNFWAGKWGPKVKRKKTLKVTN